LFNLQVFLDELNNYKIVKSTLKLEVNNSSKNDNDEVTPVARVTSRRRIAGVEVKLHIFLTLSLDEVKLPASLSS
jgi:hypothetical protein